MGRVSMSDRRKSVFGGPAPPVAVPDLLPRTRLPLAPVNQLPAQTPVPVMKPEATPRAVSEVVVTDEGFRYKRRKRVAEPQPAPPPAAAPYPAVSTHALHEALPPSLGEAERLRLVLDCICKVELHAVQRHFAGAATGPHSTQVQAPLAVADALAEWQAAVGDALSQGALRVAPPLQEGGAPQAQLLARLTAVRDAWKAEQDAWLALEADGDADQRGDAGAAASPQELATRLQQQADAAAAAASRVSADTACGALAAAVEEAQQRLQLQLADMAAVVDGAQALASRGDTACAQLAVVMEAAEAAVLGVPDAVLDSPRQLMRALCA